MSARKWMETIGWMYVVMGVGFVAVSFAPSALGEVTRIALPNANAPDRAVALFAAIGGGLTAGMGAMLALVARALDRGGAAVARAMGVGLFVWFVLDSGASIGHGAWRNALSNTLLFAPGLL